MTEYEFYGKINKDIKEYIANNLSQVEALKKIAEKYNIHERYFPRVKIIIATGYCINGKDDIDFEILKKGEN